jgi:hypothetical protein
MEESNGGILSAIGNRIKGVLVGGLVVVVSVPLTFWNEGRARQTALSLDEGAAAVVHIDPAALSADGKLVHFTGTATSEETLVDPVFSISVPAVRLRRVVETYQWTEEKRSDKSSNGRRKTVYSYTREWAEGLERTSTFHEPSGHENPTVQEFYSQVIEASRVHVGAVTLAPVLVEQMSYWQPIHLDASRPPSLMPQAKFQNDYWYGAADVAHPVVGDYRVKFESIPEGTVSVVARQSGGVADAYPTQAGPSLAMIAEGAQTSEQMFADAAQANAIFTWMLRGAAFMMMFIGLSAVLSPITSIAGYIPIFGTWIRTFTMLISGTASLVLWGVVVAVCWILVRPLLAITLLIGAGMAAAVTVGLVVLGLRSR